MIKQQVCLVEGVDGEVDYAKPPACLPESANYVDRFEKVFDQLPGYLQNVFCHLDHLYILDGKTSTASTYMVWDPKTGLPRQGIVELRKSFLDGNYSFVDWESWNLQLPFGAERKVIQAKAGLPVMISDWQVDSLYWVIVHEFGHIFDISGHYTGWYCPSEENNPAAAICIEDSKKAEPSKWMPLAWDNWEPLNKDKFPLWSSLCFYGCTEGKGFRADQQDELYDQLSAMPLISVYAAANPLEDFADTFAYYVVSQEHPAGFIFQTASGKIYDPISRLNSDPLLAGKREFMANVISAGLRL